MLYSQNSALSKTAEISIITCGPGTNELYASFGHSAFRVLDRRNGIDKVYNYGTFDFNTPNFYLKFSRGKLLYQLRAYDFGLFLQSYHRENRWVKGQVLDLTHQQTQAVFEYLEENAKPKNRSYKYDFFYDNCSTKLYDVLHEVIGDKLQLNSDFSPLEKTHRSLIHDYTSLQPWGEFGIDLALGSRIDHRLTEMEYLFLPDYVFSAFETATISKGDEIVPAIKRTENILLDFDDPASAKSNLTPWLVTIVIGSIILFVTLRDNRHQKISHRLDFILFFSTGLIGVLFLLLWFATDHTATANNFNILWAFAPNLFFAFLLKKNQQLTRYYMISLLILLDILALLWLFGVQLFPLALLPLLIGLYVRYLYLWRLKA